MLKICLLFGILISFNKSFSQSTLLSDLIGVWKWGSGKHYGILTFERDSIFSTIANYNGGLFNGHYKGTKVSYKFDSLNNEYFLKTAYGNVNSVYGRYLRLNKIDEDHFTLQLFKEIRYNKANRSSYEIDFNNKSIDTLVRLKLN
jgi:hypothetical protein